MLSETPAADVPAAPSAPPPAPAFQLVPLKMILVTGTNPRRRFDQGKLDELTDSIRKNGVLQPILLRPRATKGFELVAGERRYRAAGNAGLFEIPAVVRSMTDSEMLELQIVENLHRQDLHELEEAEGYERLMQAHGYTVEDLQAKVGKSRAYVYARLKLCALCPKSREAFYAGKLTASTALLVARIPSHELQEKATKEITEPPYSQEPLSSRQAADHIQRSYMLRLEHAPFKPADADLVPAAGSCKTCPKRSGNDRDLFQDVSRADVCTDPVCFESKRVAHVERLRQAAEASGKTVLVGKEAKKVLDGQVLKSGYVNVTEKDWSLKGDASGKPLKQVLGKDLPETMLVESPTGELMEVAKKVDVKEALDAKGVQTYQSGRQSDREDERKAKRESAVRHALLDEILRQVAEQKYFDLRPLAHHTFERLWHDAKVRLLKRRGWGTESAVTEIDRLEPEQLYYFVLECSLVPHTHVPTYNASGASKLPEQLIGMAGRLSIDVQALRKRVLDEMTKAAKAKAPAAKKGKAKPAEKPKPKTTSATPHAAAHDHRCAKCGETYRSDAPGARWTTRKGQARYLHPGCQEPGKGWLQVETAAAGEPA